MPACMAMDSRRADRWLSMLQGAKEEVLWLG